MITLRPGRLGLAPYRALPASIPVDAGAWQPDKYTMRQGWWLVFSVCVCVCGHLWAVARGHHSAPAAAGHCLKVCLRLTARWPPLRLPPSPAQEPGRAAAGGGHQLRPRVGAGHFGARHRRRAHPHPRPPAHAVQARRAGAVCAAAAGAGRGRGRCCGSEHAGSGLQLCVHLAATNPAPWLPCSTPTQYSSPPTPCSSVGGWATPSCWSCCRSWTIRTRWERGGRRGQWGAVGGAPVCVRLTWPCCSIMAGLLAAPAMRHGLPLSMSAANLLLFAPLPQGLPAGSRVTLFNDHDWTREELGGRWLQWCCRLSSTARACCRVLGLPCAARPGPCCQAAQQAGMRAHARCPAVPAPRPPPPPQSSAWRSTASATWTCSTCGATRAAAAT